MLLKDEVTLFHQSTAFDESFFICNCCMASCSAVSVTSQADGSLVWAVPRSPLPPSSQPWGSDTHSRGWLTRNLFAPYISFLDSGSWHPSLFSSALSGSCWGHLTLPCWRLPHTCRWGRSREQWGGWKAGPPEHGLGWARLYHKDRLSLDCNFEANHLIALTYLEQPGQLFWRKLNQRLCLESSPNSLWFLVGPNQGAAVMPCSTKQCSTTRVLPTTRALQPLWSGLWLCRAPGSIWPCVPPGLLQFCSFLVAALLSWFQTHFLLFFLSVTPELWHFKGRAAEGPAADCLRRYLAWAMPPIWLYLGPLDNLGLSCFPFYKGEGQMFR